MAVNGLYVKATETDLAEIIVIELSLLGHARCFFLETYQKDRFRDSSTKGLVEGYIK